MTRSEYQTSGRVLVRSPIRSTAFYPEWPANQSPLDGIRELWSDAVFRESVCVASSVLADQVDALLSPLADPGSGGRKKLDQKEHGKKVHSLYRTLLKYAIRITTRTTPFGVFGGSAVVGLGDEPLVLGRREEHRKHARVGFTYLKQLTDLAVADLGGRLRVVVNPTAHLTGDRIAVMVNPQADEGKVNEASSVRYTPPVRHVIGMAHRPVTLAAIRESLTEAFPDAAGEVLASFVDQLVEHGLLITELTPSAFDIDPVARWFRAATDGEGWLTERLRAAQDAVVDYRCTAVGEGISELKAVYAALRTDDNAAQEQLQVDLSLAISGQVPAHIAPKIEAAVGALMRMSLLSSGFPALQRHTELFAEAFGRSLVPLHRMFDPVRGIGAPAGYPSSPHRPDQGAQRGDESFEAGRRLRATLIDRARRTGSTTVAITSADLEAFPPASGTLPTSYDVFFQLDEGDEGNVRITLSPVGVAIPAGKAGGRFAYGDPAVEAHVREVARAEKTAHPEALLCELDYVSNRSRVNNVVVVPSVYDYQLRVTTGAFGEGEQAPEQIAFADLLVGAEEGRFHLVHGPTGKPVEIRTANLVNPEVATGVVRFLLENALDGKVRPAWTWGEIEPLSDFLPGVEFGGVTLSLPMWRVPVLTGTPDEQDEQLVHWAAGAGVPDHVYIGSFDNRLLLHLADRMHRDLLRREAADGAEHVTQAPVPSQMGIVRDLEGRRYASEAVFSAVARHPVPVPSPPPAPHFDVAADTLRTLPPGEEWWYLRVYGEREKQNAILSRLAAFGQEFMDSWFFIRYADPDDHLRIRVRSDQVPFDRVREVIGGCVRDRLAHRFSVDTYVRELERYGGADAMPAAERLFCTESRILSASPHLCVAPDALRAVHRLDGKESLDGPLGRLLRDTAYLMDQYLSALELTDREIQDLLEIVSDGYRSEFSSASPDLRRAIRPLVRQLPSEPALLAGPLLRDALLPDAQELTDALAKQDRPWRLRAMTLQSLLHMFANRMGLPRHREYQALFLLGVVRRAQAHREGQSRDRA
ncbi:lantibiotic dehydratase [Streptomyces sp. DSM 41527]|uniref:Lantibiotic dehydratase n=1 Tax=Streptomyces mooreae TaxID=3075523 RepID=A0ABU2TFP0_9ACTN|nr:lantibiotic dehydratase [Streptomyces sp. DSM 41527]MDT0459734.1 lantibiotic dehydratase [Streptomyces sp. DSM 41527]